VNKVRLQKYIADSGFASRRFAEKLILEGRVSVNDRVVTKLGTVVDPDSDKVCVDGKRVKSAPKVYYLLYKPRGYSVTLVESFEKTIARLLSLIPEKVIPVGRLDKTAEGLILLTNDGELANRLSRPDSGIESIYRIYVIPKIEFEAIRQIKDKGAFSSDGRLTVKEIRFLRNEKDGSWLEVTVASGEKRNHIRRLFAKYGLKVRSQIRIGFGPIRDKNLSSGAIRSLTKSEISSLLYSPTPSSDPVS